MQFLRQGVGNIRQIPTMVLPKLDIGTIGKPITNTINNKYHHPYYKSIGPEHENQETNIVKA